MELIFVREFAVLAETCNFQIAADSLSMSQSALSKHIQKLEDELNVFLFDRSKKNATLTESGKIFLNYARELCRVYDECESALSDNKVRESQTLNVGFIRILGQYSLIEQLTDFSVQHPDIQMSLFEQNGDQVRARLSSGECDFIFTAKAEDFSDDEFEKVFYKAEQMVVVLPSDHPLAGRESISFEELRYEKLIEHNTSLEKRILAKLCSDYDLKPNITASVSNSSTILRMVSEKMGICIMSSGCAEQYRNYDLARVSMEPSASFDILLVYKRRKLPPAHRAFLESFRGIRSV